MRDRFRIELTKDGLSLRQRIEPHLAPLLKAISRGPEDFEIDKGVIRFASLAEVGQTTIVPILRRFQLTHPGARFDIRLTEEYNIHEQIRAGQIDFGILTSPGNLESLRAYKLMPEKVALLTRTKNLQDPGPKKGTRQRPLHFVTYRNDDPLLNLFINKFPKTLGREEIEIVFSVNSHRSMIEALEDSNTYAVLPVASALAQITLGRLRIVPGFELQNTLYLAHFDNPYMSSLNRAFRQHMLQNSDSKVGKMPVASRSLK